MRFLVYLIFTFIILTFSLFGQDVSAKRSKKIDSLLSVLKGELHDTSRVIVLNSLISMYKTSGDADKAILFGNEALALSKKIKYFKGEARAYYHLASTYKLKADYKTALEYNFKSFQIRESLGDKKNMAMCLSEIGSVYRFQGNFNKALDFQFQALKIREKLGDKMDIATSLNGLGAVYTDKGDLQKSLEFFLKSVKLSEELGEKKDVASTYNNIGNIYHNLSDYDKALEYYLMALNLNEQSGNLKWKSINLNNLGNIYKIKKNYPKALEYYNKSLVIKEKSGDKGGMASSLRNLSNFYDEQGNHKMAIECGEKSLKIREEIGDKGGIAESLLCLGRTYGAGGEAKKGIDYLMRSEVLSIEIGARSNLYDTYLNLSIIYERLNNSKMALKYHKLYSQEKDSVLNLETSQNITKMSAQFDSEKKDNEIMLLNKDKEKQEALSFEERKKQKIITASITGGLVFVLIFAFFVYRSYRQKKSDNVEITRQKEIIEEKSKEVQASITYAKRIQNAILPSDKLFNECLPNSFILFKPKDIVSGDFYWLQKVENKILFAVVDCTGHGVPGALVSVVGQNSLNRTVKEFGLTSPSEILDKLNFLIEETFETAENEVKDGMDISLCCLNTQTNLLEWAGANNPIWIINNDGFTEIKGDKQPIGKFLNRKPFTNHRMQLQKNDHILIFTDGLADQFGGPKGKKFKYKQLKELFEQICGKNVDEQKQIISSAFEDWKSNLEQVDDVCVMGITV